MADRPAWALRLRRERVARGWSQRETVRAMRAQAAQPLPDDETLLRNWKRWESGLHLPDSFYQSLIARTLGTVTAAVFPARPAEPCQTGGMEAAELLSRLKASDVDRATLDALWATSDALCSAYRRTPAEALRRDGLQWLGQVTGLLHGRLTLAQHREVLTIAGWLALLVGCAEFDLGWVHRAEATRLAALSLGQEAGHPEIIGWAYEMQAWQALTRGHYRGVMAAAEAGEAAAVGHGVAVQLAAQRAKAWARIGDRREVMAALDQGRAQLDAIPPGANLNHHFVVDPAKFDFYAMDCYRLLGEDRLATLNAEDVITNGTDADGVELTPMRNAEARVTLGVAAARAGDLDQAVHHGVRALSGGRKSLPSLLMVSRELAGTLHGRYGGEPAVRDYLAHLRELTRRADPPA